LLLVAAAQSGPLVFDVSNTEGSQLKMAKARQITFKSDSWFFMYLRVPSLLSVRG
jgi:hypothetical protein